MTKAIPLIDIEALSSPDAAARRRVAGDIGRACRDIGFFAIRGHGVADRVVDRTFGASRELFALPDAIKHVWPPEPRRAMHRYRRQAT